MSTIGYNTAKEGQNRSGITMIEPKVVSYNFNDKYIIAKTVGVYDEAIKYWIIDKELNRSSNLIGLDSIAFQKELLDRNIKLKLEQ